MHLHMNTHKHMTTYWYKVTTHAHTGTTQGCIIHAFICNIILIHRHSHAHSHYTCIYAHNAKHWQIFTHTCTYMHTCKTLSYTHVYIYTFTTQHTKTCMYEYTHHTDIPTCAHVHKHMHAYFLSRFYNDKLLIPPPWDEVNLNWQAKSFPHVLKGYANFPLVLISQQSHFQSWLCLDGACSGGKSPSTDLALSCLLVFSFGHVWQQRKE